MHSPEAASGFSIGGVFTAICIGKDGREKWRETGPNIVVSEGLTSVLSVNFNAGTQLTAWFLGVTDATPTIAAADTLASHSGWVEETGYTGTRPAWTEGAPTTSPPITITNSTSVDLAITSSATIGGLFLCSVTSGTSGTLFAVQAFTGGNQAVDNGDTLRLTYTITAAP